MLDRRILHRDENGSSIFWFYLKQYDPVQLGALAFLLITGLVFIGSIGVQGEGAFFDGFFFRQIIWVILGVVIYTVTAHFNYRDWRVLGVAFYLITIVLLILVLIDGIGVKVYGARRWLDFGPLRLQPSELMKLALIMLLAGLLEMSNFKLNSYMGIAVVAIVILLPFVLIFKEPDLGGAILLLPVGAAMVFIGGLQKKYIVKLLVLATLLFAIGGVNEYFQIKPLLKAYHINRIKGFFNPDAKSLRDSNYQQKQAEIAVGSGGVFGKGIGAGTQNLLGFLPAMASNNDFVFSVIAEETGFVGCLMVLLAYAILLYSILRTGYMCNDMFGKLISTGIGVYIFCQIMVNVGVNIGLFPVTGLALPFISYGGSAMFVGMAGLGVVQSVWRHRTN